MAKLWLVSYRWAIIGYLGNLKIEESSVKRIDNKAFLVGTMVLLLVLSIISFTFGVALLISTILAILSSSWLFAVLLGLICFVIIGFSLIVFWFAMDIFANFQKILDKWESEKLVN